MITWAGSILLTLTMHTWTFARKGNEMKISKLLMGLTGLVHLFNDSCMLVGKPDIYWVKRRIVIDRRRAIAVIMTLVTIS
jgi:hypothetical protein